MPVDDDETLKLGLPDADLVYRNYLETRRRLGVEPVPRERAHDLIEEWTETIKRGGVPPIRH